jgi:hypothetical protein
MEDSALDQLLTDAFGSETADAAPGPEEAAPEVVDATATEDAQPPETESAPPESAPDDTPEVAAAGTAEETPAPTEGVQPPEDVSSQLAAVQAELARQQAIAANQAQLLAAWNQREAAVQQQQEQAAFQQQVAQLQAQWDKLDPDDAAKQREQFLYQTAQAEIARRDQELAQLRWQREQEEVARKEAENKPKVVDLIVQKFGLSEADKALLMPLPDPYSMEAVAQTVKAQRQAQTQAARDTRAQQLASSKAFAPTGASGAVASQPKTYDTLDDLLTDVLSG